MIERGAELISAPFPLGAEGSKAWFEAAAEATVSIRSGHSKCLKCRISAQTRGVGASLKARGKTDSLLPDSQLEIPMARFLSEECGLSVNEIGTPFHDQLVMRGELARLPQDVPMVEGQDLDPALARVRAARPDLTVCGMGIANALESEGSELVVH